MSKDLSGYSMTEALEESRLKRENTALRAEIRQTQAAIEDLTKRLGLYEMLDETPIQPPKWLTPKRRKQDHVGIPSVAIADIHFDEKVDPAQVGGINKYDRRIALQRLRRAFERTVRLSTEYLSGVEWEGFNLMLPGDNFSGIIHEELKETNEAQIMDSVISLVEPMVSGIRLLRETFGSVHVSGVVGNHGRNTKKPKAKHRAQDNFDWLVYKLIEREMRDEQGLSFNFPIASDARIRLYDTRYLLTHGDQFRGGSGISGLLAPLMLGASRKMARDAASGNPYDIMVMGHWHQTLSFPSRGLIVAGSVVGYNEYNFVSNHSPEVPQCPFWVTTPEHGVTFTAPVFVQDRAKENW